MSIGLGIFLTALLLVVVWQIDKRKAWKKSLIGIAAACVLVASVVGGFLWWDSTGPSRRAKAELKSLQSGGEKSYWGIRLGMSMDEVRYLKGPHQNDKFEIRNAPRELPQYWFYKGSDGGTAQHTYIIEWSADQKVTAVTCIFGDAFDCEPLIGIRVHDDEAEVVSKFGVPDKTEPVDSDGRKFVDYGPPTTRVKLALIRGKVSSLTLLNEQTRVIHPK